MYPDNNIFSYLKWRGDIHLTQAPFNDIDALVLAIFLISTYQGLFLMMNQQSQLKQQPRSIFQLITTVMTTVIIKNCLS